MTFMRFSSPHSSFLFAWTQSKGSLREKAWEKGTLMNRAQKALGQGRVMVNRIKLAPGKDESKPDRSWVKAKYERKAKAHFLKSHSQLNFAIVI